MITRQYYPIWRELKDKGIARLAVPKGVHRRVIKAVLKEKYMDVGFRLQMLEQKIRLRIEYECSGNVIVMRLLKLPTFLSSITAEDL
jgi:hypothetical protein